MADLKQVGTLSCDSEMLETSVITSTSWLATCFKCYLDKEWRKMDKHKEKKT